MQVRHRFRISLALTVLCVVSLPLHAAVYKWTDPDGSLRYGQVPPPGVQAQPLKAAGTDTADTPVADDATPATADPARSEAGNQAGNEAESEAVRAQQAERAAKQQAEREAYCKRARAELKTMEERTSYRMARVDENGKPARMTTEDFEAHRASVEAGIREHCG